MTTSPDTASLTADPAWRTAMPDAGVTQGRVLRSEWTKFRSLRSTYITIVLASLFTIGIGLLVCAVQANRWPREAPPERAAFRPVFSSLVGVEFAQLALGVLGVLLFSGEYSTGMIRSTLVAVAKRLPVLWAKVAVFAAVVGAMSLVSVFVAFWGGQALLSPQHIQTSLGAPGVLRQVVGAALCLVVVGILAVGLGALVRSTAGGISTLVGLLFVLPVILNVLPSSWSDRIGPYLPSTAGEALWANPDGAHLAPWAGFGVLCAWAAAAVAVAAVTLRRRDA